MTEAPHRAVLMVGRLEALASELRRAYRVTVVVQEERRPFPALEAISAKRRGIVLAGAVHYWWHGDALRVIGPVTDVHGAARWIADRLEAAHR